MHHAPALARRLIQPPWRDVLIAVGVFLGGLLLYLADMYTLRVEPAGTPWWRLGLLAAGSATLLMRRNHPGLALALGALPVTADLVLGLSLPMSLVAGDVLYSATLNGSRALSRTLFFATVASPIVTFVVALVLLPNWRTAIPLTVGIVALPLIAVGWGREVRRHREVADAERTRSGQLARIAELDRQAAIAEERSRMARDLHDVIAGHLSAIAIQSEAVLSVADRDRETVHAVLRSVRENSIEALTEMRAMIDLLRAGTGHADDPPTAPPRLVELDRLVESARAGGLRVTRTDDPPVDGLPSVVDLTAYRIVQEALTNAVKHAEGARADVTVRRDGSRLLIEVTNELPQGVSTRAAPPGGGTGLTSMHERAAALGGTLDAGRHGAGWRVRARLPVPPTDRTSDEKVQT
ncbi:sensor histidine kinase [Pseudonocardia spinosispora]|uniref:sensor histidine kinase n=1 Tax=Pseudonocardia spinosispora TaxID=103441 RepID=UPI0004125FA5|nr:sensor histidine kinase [Pseudonocardia spinosispora]